MNKAKRVLDFIDSSDLDKFESFCRRQWLDFCDEHGGFGGQHLEYEEYTSEYSNYLMEKYGASKK